MKRVGGTDIVFRSCGVLLGALVLTLVTLFAVEDVLKEEPEGEKESKLLEQMLNFPFEGNDDLEKVNKLAEVWGKILLLQGEEQLKDHFEFWELLNEVQAFTNTKAGPGEQFFILSYSQTNDKALRRLRDEIGLAAPSGGAIVRIYTNVLAMPEPIRSLFTGEAAAITRWCRFIALLSTGGKTQQEVDDALSHELAHAFLSSTLCLGRDSLPRWFHEGLALHLSDAKDLYLNYTGHESGRMAWSPKDYTEFKRVFQYLESRFGHEGLNRFIRQSVLSKSVDEPLRALTGKSDYSELKGRAIGWRRQQLKGEEFKTLLVVIMIALIIFWFFTRGR